MNVINDLLDYNDMKIIQNPNMFCYSLDSIILPNFITIKSNVKKILDIGCGNAPIPLILTTKTNADIDAVEYQKEIYELAKSSVELNRLEDRINLICGDIKEVYKNIKTETYDIITCNPPYFKIDSTSRKNISKYKSIARHELYLNIEDVCKISKKILKNKGILGVVHRPERLFDVLEAMKKNNITPKKIQFVHPNEQKEANILLVEGVKNGNDGVKILKPIFTHENNGSYREEIINNYFRS